MRRQKLPALCALTAGLLLFALVTDGFAFTQRPNMPFWLFAGGLFAVRVVCAVLTAAGLALCRAQTRRQAVHIFVLCVVLSLCLGIPALLTGGGTQADLSRMLPGFVLMLAGTCRICRTGLRGVLSDFAALGASVFLLLSPGLLFGWGVCACFFDALSIVTTLFFMAAADGVRAALPGLRRVPHRERS